jgi:hypothetical protein
MNYFDVLLGANAIVAIVALYQLRICTLIIVGNNLLVARSLSSIERYGHPASQWYVPASVFSPENLSTAAHLMTFSLATVVLFMAISLRQRVRIGPDAPAVPKPVLWLVGAFFVVYMVSSGTIFSAGYTSEARARFNFEFAGGTAFVAGILLYEIARRRLLALITARRAFGITSVLFFFAFYLKGSTGITTGFMLTSAVLFLPRTGAARRLSNLIRICVVFLVILAISAVIRPIREGIAEDGWSSVKGAVEGVVQSEKSREDSSEGLEALGNATQYSTHMLMCETLYDEGISREWRSIYNVVEYTFKPSFTERWLGWQRSIDAREELRYYYTHLGGLYVLGEFYWNGGWLCVVIMVTLLSLFASVVDARYRASPFWLMMMVQFAPSFLMGYGYGFAQVSRGAINGLLATGIYWALSRLRKPPITAHAGG